MSTRTLTDIAAELYSTAPADFIQARNAAAKAASDPDLGKQIRALRKPSITAWIINLFAGEQAEMLGQALDLANELREAQADLDAAALSALGKERRALTQRLAEQAAQLAESRGEKVTASTLEAVRQTLSAAFFDPDAAAAVASGRLIRELEPSESLPAGLEGVVAGGAPAEVRRKPAPPVDEVRARRERRDAERALHEAEKALLRSERSRAEAERHVKEARERAERLARHAEELGAELARVRGAVRDAEAEITASAEKSDAAADRVEDAKRTTDAARSALEALRDGR